MIEYGFFDRCNWVLNRYLETDKFPAGELSIKLNGCVANKQQWATGIQIKAIIKSSDDILALVMLTDALRRRYDLPIKLSMPYIPYARQDRVCNEGEALSIKVFADLINSQNYTEVEVVDPHSDVAPALLNRCKVIPVEDLIKKHMGEFIDKFDDEFSPPSDLFFICPDGGAIKKLATINQFYPVVKTIQGNKVRNTKSGKILETTLSRADFQDRPSLIIDDICDGGRTFIELAKLIKQRNGGKIYLWVTHGIFSKGLGVFHGLIDHIYTTDSYCELESNDKLTVFKL